MKSFDARYHTLLQTICGYWANSALSMEINMECVDQPTNQPQKKFFNSFVHKSYSRKQLFEIPFHISQIPPFLSRCGRQSPQNAHSLALSPFPWQNQIFSFQVQSHQHNRRHHHQWINCVVCLFLFHQHDPESPLTTMVKLSEHLLTQSVNKKYDQQQQPTWVWFAVFILRNSLLVAEWRGQYVPPTCATENLIFSFTSVLFHIGKRKKP